MTTDAHHNEADGVLTSAAGHVTDAATAAARGASDAAHSAREKAGVAAEVVRERAADAYDAAKEKVDVVGHEPSSPLEPSPLAIVAGGVALGAILGELLPRSESETQLLRPVADKASAAATLAFTAARDAGQSKLDELGVNREAARAKVDELVNTAAQAASSAGSAAKDAVRGRTDG